MQFSPEQLRLTEAWVFDLDNTLYCASTNLFGQVDVRMKSFIADFLGIEPNEAFKIQKKYFRDYGTTLRGLMDLHDIDPKTFLDYVHDIDVQVLQPNPVLDRALEELPGRKIIFTNADVGHTLRVMERLGVSQHFEAIFDIVASDYIPKPQPEVYQALVKRFDLIPKRTVMFEDMARNLKPAADMGMTTVWVRTDTLWGQESSEEEHIHHATDDLPAWLSNIAASY
jgi:putative hydrolase of the HAD superfamily